jgi:hypothetical protein
MNVSSLVEINEAEFNMQSYADDQENLNNCSFTLWGDNKERRFNSEQFFFIPGQNTTLVTFSL